MLVEKGYFIRYIMKKFDCKLVSITALEFPGIAELAKRNFPIVFWDIDSPNIPYSKYAPLIKDGHIIFCYSIGGQKYGRSTGLIPTSSH